MKTSKQYTKLTRISVVALMSALGYVLMLLEFPLPFLIPSFVKFDFSEVPALIAAYMFGPVEGIVVCLVKNLLKALFFSMSSGVGEICNFLLGCAMVVPAALGFKKLKKGSPMLIGGLFGALMMGVLSLPINYFITYPIYANFLPIDQIVEMYQAIIPSVDGLLVCLLVFNVPFTFLKGVVSVVIAYLISKRITLKAK